MSSNALSRRQFAQRAAGGFLAATAPALIRRDTQRPGLPCGVASGDIGRGSAIVWSRTDRPARMFVEWSTTESFAVPHLLPGSAALPEDDFTSRTVLSDLPSGQTIFYRVRFQDLAEPKSWSERSVGQFHTAPDDDRPLRLAWSGDTAGQGYGIDPSRGGMKTYASIAASEPHLFVHSGDHIYADNPIEPELPLDNGSLWRNLTSEAKSKVAETLAEFRGNYLYNLQDTHIRSLNSKVAQVVQWDDHETRNNWYPGQILDDPRYQIRSVDLLAARARRAFLEYTPIRRAGADLERIDRVIRLGPNADLFVLDARTARGPNSANRQPTPGPESAFLGASQLSRLKIRLRRSQATWKIIACDMPLGLVIGDGPGRFEAVANADNGTPLGREIEIADLLAFLRREQIRNTLWITADVHYAAAHHYDPVRASFDEFDPFWEFVAGPLHAGTFGPAALDATFGPEVRFCALPPGMKPNRPPSEGLQFFGLLDITRDSLSASLHDREGRRLYDVTLPRIESS